jgi:hypothetical protein
VFRFNRYKPALHMPRLSKRSTKDMGQKFYNSMMLSKHCRLTTPSIWFLLIQSFWQTVAFLDQE